MDEIDSHLIKKYDVAGPRYTSYPTAMQLICHFNLVFNKIEKKFKINFKKYFSHELKQLSELQNDRND